MAERRLIVEPIDIRRAKAGGIDTCIRGLVKFKPDDMELFIVGVDSTGEAILGEWSEVDVDGTPVNFMAVARSDPKAVHARIPHALKVMVGVLRRRSVLTGFDSYQAHRITVGYVLRRIWRKVPHIQFVHNDGQDNLKAGSESYFTRAVFAYRFLERKAVRESNDVVVFNKAGAERLSAHGSHVRFSPTWYDDEHFFPPETGGAPPGTRALFVGRIDLAKDPLLAVSAFAKLPSDYSLTMVGSGSLEGDVNEAVKGMGLSDAVKLVGVVPKRQVAEYMRSHDLLLITSHYEGYPRTVVEALACGLPIVATDGGEPNGLVIEQVNGARVEGREPETVARAIERTSGIDQAACVASVSELAASKLVPVVLGR